MTLGGFHLGIIDAVMIVLALLFGVSGFKNGFFKEIVGVGAFIGAVILSYLLASWVEGILIQTPIYPLLFDTLRSSVFTGMGLYETIIDSTQPGALEFLTDGLTQIGLPGFLASPLAGLLITFNGTLGDALATSSAYFIILILSYLGTFLVGWLLLFIIGSQLVKLTKDVKAFKFIDSILGFGLGLGRAVVVIGIALLIAIPLTFVVPEVNTFITQDLALGETAFSIGKTIYEFALNLISGFIPS